MVVVVEVVSTLAVYSPVVDFRSSEAKIEKDFDLGYVRQGNPVKARVSNSHFVFGSFLVDFVLTFLTASV